MVIFDRFLEASWSVTLELAPWLLLGTAVAALLHVLLPVDLVRRRLRGYRGVVTAVALGVPLPLCSCGVIPAGIGLRRDGASRGSAVGFLVSTPQTGVDSVLVSASFLGWPFALFKLAIAAVTGVVAGWITEADAPEGTALVAQGSIEPALGSRDPSRGDGHGDGNPGPRQRSASAAFHHANGILRSIWRYLLVGVLVSAAITTFVPSDGLAGLAAYGGFVAGLAALLFSLPLYVCATASVPIAAALVAGGLPAGAALVFLLAGPATNVATIGAIHRTFGARTLTIYLSTLIVGSLGGGLVFDRVLDVSAVSHHGQHEMSSWWATASAIALCALVLLYLGDDLRTAARRYVLSRGTADSRSFSVDVSGMHCGGCVRTVEGVLGSLDGVQSVAVDLDGGRVEVFGCAEPSSVRQALEAAGYGAVPGTV